MSTEFAEKMLDSMVDENGHCGERGLSQKQFDILSRYLEQGEWRVAGFWEGEHAVKTFEECDFEGDIGRYHVKLNLYCHFHDRCSVVSIDPRPAKDIEREERAAELAASLTNSQWQGEEGKRQEIELTLVRDYAYEVPAYGWNAGYDVRHIYTFADAEGNCYIWKTTNGLYQDAYDEHKIWNPVYAEIGDRLTLKGTVKEHDEYRGVKQTVLTRCKVIEVHAA